MNILSELGNISELQPFNFSNIMKYISNDAHGECSTWWNGSTNTQGTPQYRIYNPTTMKGKMLNVRRAIMAAYHNSSMSDIREFYIWNTCMKRRCISKNHLVFKESTIKLNQPIVDNFRDSIKIVDGGNSTPVSAFTHVYPVSTNHLENIAKGNHWDHDMSDVEKHNFLNSRPF